MLLFSTVLEVNDKLTKDEFIQLVIEWNQKSPYESNIIPNIVWNGEHCIRFGDEKVWMEIVEYRNANIIAIRYEKKEDNGAIWDSDYVMNFSSMKMSIRLDRSYIEDALSVNPKFSTPHFITLLIERGYLEPDGELQVRKDSLIIDKNHIKMLSNIINGNIHYRLPIVYISKTSVDEYPVDVSLIANKLKGVAHVLAQESVTQNKTLMYLCNKQNEYYGAIGIYYPTRAAGHRRYLYRYSFGQDQVLLEKVVRAVIQYSNSQQIDTLFTWQGVNNALLRDRLTSQREERIAAELAKKNAEDEYLRLLDEKDEEQKQFQKKAMDDARAEADTLLESFDEDIAKMQKQIEELTRANEALQYENQGLRAKFEASDTIPFLFMGDEHEFYPGEIKDLILTILSDALDSLPPKSRRGDVIRDILRNNDFKRIGKDRASKLKAALKNYDGMTSKLRQVFEELGFVLTEDGKHIKATYYGDGRYHITLAKTPSDGRAGKNLVSETIKICF